MNSFQYTGRILCLLAMLTVSVSFAPGQEKTEHHELLWRLTKHGIHDTSYVFGTAHVRHPDVYKFGDALRPAVLSCSVFANEIELTELIGWITTTQEMAVEYDDYSTDDEMDNDTSSEDDDDDDDTYADAEEPTVDSAVRAKRVRQLNMLEIMHAQSEISERLLHRIRRVDSSTSLLYEHPLDFYLWGYAMLAGKTTIGLEKVEDMLELVTKLGANVQEKMSRANEDSSTKGNRVQHLKRYLDLAKMFRSYLNGDVQMISTCLKRLTDSSYYAELISNRNHVMARSIDSIAQSTSVFAAVGAGHLGEDDGVLALLRKKGWSVTPVRQSFLLPNYDLDWEVGYTLFDTTLSFTTTPISASFPRYPSLTRQESTDELDWEYIIAYDSTTESDVRLATRRAVELDDEHDNIEGRLSKLATTYGFEKPQEIIHLGNGQTWLISPNSNQGTRSLALTLFGEMVVFASVDTFKGVSDMHLRRFIEGVVRK